MGRSASPWVIFFFCCVEIRDSSSPCNLLLLCIFVLCDNVKGHHEVEWFADILFFRGGNKNGATTRRRARIARACVHMNGNSRPSLISAVHD